MKKILSLVLVLLLSLSVFSGFALAEENSGDVLNIALASKPETIDPARNSAVDGACYAIHQFEPLFRYKWDGEGVEPGMAESYEVSEDGMVWTFHLRDSKWSDGEPVKAQDFEFAYKRLVNPELAAPYGGDMGAFIKNGLKIASRMDADGKTVEDHLAPFAIEEGADEAAVAAYEAKKAEIEAAFVPMSIDEMGIKAIDDKTVEITLETPCPFFTEIVAFPVFSPVRQDIIEKYGDDNWVKGPESYVTNGAFMMESFSLDESMVSVPNPGYWDAASIKPSKINWLFMVDDKAELAALRAGEADFIDGFPQEESQALKADGLHGMIPQLGTYYVSFNTQKAPFDNVLVRKALTLAIDTDFIASVLREGRVAPAEAFVGTGFRTSGASKDFRDGYKSYVAPSSYEENKKLAQEALAEAGYPGGEGLPKIEYLLNDDTGHIMIAEAIQNMWKEVLGVNIEIRVAEWAVVTADRREGNFNIARNGWIGDYNDPATMLTLFLSTSGNNDGKYSNPAFDAKIAESMSETDPEKRDQLMHEAEDIMMGEDWACAPIYYYSDEWAVRQDLMDWGITPLGYKFFHKAYLQK